MKTSNTTKTKVLTVITALLISSAQSESIAKELDKKGDQRSRTTVTPYFCPKDSCANKLIEQIVLAKKYVHVAIYTLTLDEVVDALINAHRLGIEVKVIGEKENNTAPANGQSAGTNYYDILDLKAAGVSYKDDGNDDLMHNKYTIIDGKTVVTGSFNYTYSADNYNNENLLTITSSDIAEKYEADFQTLWSAGTP